MDKEKQRAHPRSRGRSCIPTKEKGPGGHHATSLSSGAFAKRKKPLSVPNERGFIKRHREAQPRYGHNQVPPFEPMDKTLKPHFGVCHSSLHLEEEQHALEKTSTLSYTSSSLLLNPSYTSINESSTQERGWSICDQLVAAFEATDAEEQANVSVVRKESLHDAFTKSPGDICLAHLCSSVLNYPVPDIISSQSWWSCSGLLTCKRKHVSIELLTSFEVEFANVKETLKRSMVFLHKKIYFGLLSEIRNRIKEHQISTMPCLAQLCDSVLKFHVHPFISSLPWWPCLGPSICKRRHVSTRISESSRQLLKDTLFSYLHGVPFGKKTRNQLILAIDAHFEKQQKEEADKEVASEEGVVVHLEEENVDRDEKIKRARRRKKRKRGGEDGDDDNVDKEEKEQEEQEEQEQEQQEGDLVVAKDQLEVSVVAVEDSRQQELEPLHNSSCFYVGIKVSWAFESELQRITYIILKKLSSVFKQQDPISQTAISVSILASKLGWEQKYAHRYGGLESFLLKEVKNSLHYRGYRLIGVTGGFKVILDDQTSLYSSLSREKVECFGEETIILVLDRIQVWMESHGWTLAPVNCLDSVIKWEVTVFGPVRLFLEYLEKISHPLFIKRLQLIRNEKALSSDVQVFLLGKSVYPIARCYCSCVHSLDSKNALGRSDETNFVKYSVQKDDLQPLTSSNDLTALSQEVSFSFGVEELDLFECLDDVNASGSSFASDHTAIVDFYPGFSATWKPISKAPSSASIINLRQSTLKLSEEDSMFIQETMGILEKKKEALNIEIMRMKAAIAEKKKATKRKLVIDSSTVPKDPKKIQQG